MEERKRFADYFLLYCCRQDLRREDTQDFGAHRLTGSMDFAAANRISYVYDLRGPR